jgi:hypothetical protein
MTTPTFDRAEMHPQLRTARDEISATVVRALAYVSGVGVLALFVAGLFETPKAKVKVEPPPVREWIDIGNTYRSFALTLPEFAEAEPTYTIFRHARGDGRKDIMTWGEAGAPSSRFMLEIYRPGREFLTFSDPSSEIAARIGDLGTAERLRPAETLQSKFGPVTLVDFTAKSAKRTRSCLGFVRPFKNPPVQIAGWYCRPGIELVDRGTITCALDRLTLMMAASDPKVSELFAHAERKRAFCKPHTGQRPATRHNDFIDAAKPPKLRGRLAAK